MGKETASTSPEVEVYLICTRNRVRECGQERKMKSKDRNQIMEGFAGPCKAVVFGLRAEGPIKGFGAEG